MNDRSQITYTPGHELFGDSKRWTRTIRGKQYRFNAVLMPDGERRYFASVFNGYAGGPRFACAWTPVLKWIIKP
ncbi:MAG TPA: hypothetical protein VFE08_14525 [Candidatus Sulfotelmatobacter sp.]|nr:hypothetical protein [Candidatus Sulfotelmatobacter sp.]